MEHDSGQFSRSSRGSGRWVWAITVILLMGCSPPDDDSVAFTGTIPTTTSRATSTSTLTIPSTTSTISAPASVVPVTTPPPPTTVRVVVTSPPSTEVPPPVSEPPAPAADDSHNWDAVAECESNGDWHINTGNGYYGGLQFSLPSWQGVGGTGYPHEHSRAEQINRAEQLLAIQGRGAWPHCGRYL